jgi:hypothetical protein
VLVVLDSQFRQLAVHGFHDRRLRLGDPLASLGIAAHDMKCAPGQQARDRIQVRGEHVATQSRRLERN